MRKLTRYLGGALAICCALACSLAVFAPAQSAQAEWEKVTITLDAGQYGHFSNGEKQLELSGYPGDRITGWETPVINDGVEDVAFDSWIVRSSSSYGWVSYAHAEVPTVFPSITHQYDAHYVDSSKTITITTNANGGTFLGGATSWSFTGHPGINPSDPVLTSPDRLGSFITNYAIPSVTSPSLTFGYWTADGSVVFIGDAPREAFLVGEDDATWTANYVSVARITLDLQGGGVKFSVSSGSLSEEEVEILEELGIPAALPFVFQSISIYVPSGITFDEAMFEKYKEYVAPSTKDLTFEEFRTIVADFANKMIDSLTFIDARGNMHEGWHNWSPALPIETLAIPDHDTTYRAMWDGWNEVPGKGWYFGTGDGYYHSGWQWVYDHWYYFDEDGFIRTNQWIWDNGSWYYVDGSGAMVTNCWSFINGAWYGFWANGTMCKGWVWDSGYNNYFYCDPNSGAMYTNCWSWINGAWYGFWANGEMCYGWVWDSAMNGWTYCDWQDGWMYTNGWYLIGGVWYKFNASGRLIS